MFEGFGEEEEAPLRRKRHTAPPASPISRMPALFSLVNKPLASSSLPIRPELPPSLKLKPEFAYLTFFQAPHSLLIKVTIHSYVLVYALLERTLCQLFQHDLKKQCAILL